MTRIAASRLSVEIPRGWDAQIRPAGVSNPSAARTAATAGPSVLHTASFALPATRGDYGSGAVEVMGGSDILICLLEHEPEAASTPLFRRKSVPALTPAAFSPQTMQRALPGMSGAQHYFQVDGRPFCLYVVVGSHATRGPLVRTAASVVKSLRFD